MHRLLSIVIALVVFTAATGIGATGAHDGVAAAQVDCAFPTSVTDATGENVTVEEEPERIVAVQPSDAQTLWEIGAQEKVVGMPVNQYTEYLDGHDQPQDITDDGNMPVTERIVDLDPDLVVAAASTDEEQVDQLRDAGLTVYQFTDATSIDDVIETTETTGRLTGECAGANETVDWMNEEINAVEEAVGDQEEPTVFYALGDGFTAGNGTFIDEIITTAGGENLASAAGIEFYGQISEEVVIAEDPERIVYPDDNFDQPPVSDRVLSETTAGQEGQVVAVDSNRLNQPGPQVVYAIRNLAETLHPDAYTASDGATNDSNETADGGNDSATEDNQSAPGESEGQPGFGVPAAVVALVAAALLVLRRR